MLISRATPLLIEWADDSWTIHDVRAETSYRVSRDVLRFLECVGDGIDTDDLRKELDADQDVIDEQVQHLLALGLVRNSPADPGESESDVVMSSLGTTAKHFHTATRDANFLLDDSAYLKKVSGEGRPSFTKEYPQAPLLPLPRVFAPLSTNLRDVLEGRRTHRDFSSEPVSIDQLATALHYTFAPLRFLHSEYWGTLGLKASASGGARNEAEAYVVPLNVTDVPVGVYHYNADRHALEDLETPVDADKVEQLTAHQEFCGAAGFVVFVTAVSHRFVSKYRHPRAYRGLMMGVGHLGQTFAMVMTGMGLGAFTTGSFHDSGVEKLLGLDPREEFSTYVIGGGRPVLRDGGLPYRQNPVRPGPR